MAVWDSLYRPLIKHLLIPSRESAWTHSAWTELASSRVHASAPTRLRATRWRGDDDGVRSLNKAKKFKRKLIKPVVGEHKVSILVCHKNENSVCSHLLSDSASFSSQSSIFLQRSHQRSPSSTSTTSTTSTAASLLTEHNLPCNTVPLLLII